MRSFYRYLELLPSSLACAVSGVAVRGSIPIGAMIALLGLPSLGVRSSKAATDTVEGIATALSCGRIGGTETVLPGQDLYRTDMNLSTYPNAVCNDGTPATMFVRRYSKKKDKNKWIIFLIGGGHCTSGQSCAQRWCSIDTPYGEDKMSTSFLSKKSIAGNGIFNPNASINNFAGWNQVFVWYCSSDDWSGSVSDVHLSATDANGKQVDYLINFRGADIVEAVIGTLQRQPQEQPVAYKDSDGAELVMPDLDKAELVLFAGSSAGGGAKNNVDRVGELLRKGNKWCKNSNECPLVYLGVVDASYPPSYERLDLTQATFCTDAPFLCSYEVNFTAYWNAVSLGTWNARGDESCVKWHHDHMPGTEWRCADQEHVVENHLTTPLFIRMDHQDQTHLSNYVDTGLTTPTQFGQLVHSQLLNLPDLDKFAEEGSVRSGGPSLQTPGVFGPQCTQHYGLSVSTSFYLVTVSDSGKSYNFHDVLWNWVQGARPQQLVRDFAAPGPAPDCP